MKMTQIGFSFAAALALLAAVPVFNIPRAAAVSASQQATGLSDRQIQSELAGELKGDRFRNVHVAVSKGIVDLSGSVGLFADKEAAEKKAHRAKKATAIRNEIRVEGTQISDQDLLAKLVQKLEYDRVGYGSTTFNAISVAVRDGVVTLGGHAYGPTDKFSALAVAGYTPGVQDVIDGIEVDPVSPMDDRIRLSVARAVYGYPSLNKYAIDPGRPIRISVQNGNVSLYGVVDSAADKDTANIRANGVAGVFKVSNELRVEGAVSERD